MKSKKAVNQKAKANSTQRHLPIAEVKDNVVILKDGTIRKVLMVSSINFALKSEDEQNALISSYVSFLNSLEFPLQIVVQSRKLQIEPYLAQLREIEGTLTNELLRVQVADYRSFVTELVDIGQIMTKRFYVVVPYDPASSKKKSFWARFKEVLKPASLVRVKEERFRKLAEEIDSRVRLVSSGLASMGLQAVEMDTQALIELYYSSYNPDIAFSEPMRDVEEIRID